MGRPRKVNPELKVAAQEVVEAIVHKEETKVGITNDMIKDMMQGLPEWRINQVCNEATEDDRNLTVALFRAKFVGG